MTRLLQSDPKATPAATVHTAAADPPDPLTVDPDVVVILAALLCALICVVGLALVARCAWLRRSSSAGPPPPPPPPNKGLKKKTLRAMPTVPYDAAAELKGCAECAICLAEFVEGETIRILPHCGHGFHASCVDAWLRSHSTCPSCRRVLAVAACHRCGAAAPDWGVGAGPRDVEHGIRYLP